MRVGQTISKYSVALLVIVLVGLFLRIYDLGIQSLWLDEAVSVTMANMNLTQIVQAMGAENHPPLYYFILHYWVALFGTSEAAVRLLSVLFGVLAIPIIYLLGRSLFNEEVGLLAALILAFSTFNVQYSQEARMYSLMFLLALLSMYFFTCFLKKNTVAVSVVYIISTTLLLYTHIYGVFVLIAQNVYLLALLFLSREHTFRLKHWITLQALVLAIFTPWISVLISQISRVEKGFWAQPPTIGTLVTTLATYSGTTVLLLVFLAMALFSFLTFRKLRGAMNWKAPISALKSFAWEVSITQDKAFYFLTVWLLTVNVIPFVISRFSTPIYAEKYTIAASVALYLIVAKGITHIDYKYAKYAVIIAVVALSAANLQTFYATTYKPQAREATELIDENAKSGDLVLISPGYHKFAFDYYNNVTGLNVKSFPSRSGSDSANNIKEFQSDIDGQNRVWFMEAHESGSLDKQVVDQIMRVFNESYNRTYSESYLGYDVYLFEKRP